MFYTRESLLILCGSLSPRERKRRNNLGNRIIKTREARHARLVANLRSAIYRTARLRFFFFFSKLTAGEMIFRDARGESSSPGHSSEGSRGSIERSETTRSGKFSNAITPATVRLFGQGHYEILCEPRVLRRLTTLFMHPAAHLARSLPSPHSLRVERSPAEARIPPIHPSVALHCRSPPSRRTRRLWYKVCYRNQSVCYLRKRKSWFF